MNTKKSEKMKNGNSTDWGSDAFCSNPCSATDQQSGLTHDLNSTPLLLKREFLVCISKESVKHCELLIVQHYI